MVERRKVTNEDGFESNDGVGVNTEKIKQLETSELSDTAVQKIIDNFDKAFEKRNRSKDK